MFRDGGQRHIQRPRELAHSEFPAGKPCAASDVELHVQGREKRRPVRNRSAVGRSPPMEKSASVSRLPSTQVLPFRESLSTAAKRLKFCSPRVMKAGSGGPRPSTFFEPFSYATMPHDSASQCALSQNSQRRTSAWPFRSDGHTPLSGRLDAM